MKKQYLISIAISFFIIASSNIIFAHGSKYNIIKGGIGIEAKYMDNTPMSDCNGLVFAPDNHNDPYITCVMDKDGRLLFFPHKMGEWIIKISDGMGHSLTAKLQVDEELKLSKTTEDGSLSGVQVAVMTICVTWGLIGTGLYFKKKETN